MLEMQGVAAVAFHPEIFAAQAAVDRGPQTSIGTAGIRRAAVRSRPLS